LSTAAFTIGDGPAAVEVGGGKLFLIAGPCVIESRDSALRHSARLVEISRQTGVPIIYKSSFDKANRTSFTSYRGPGMHDGLEILAEVRRTTGLPVLTDVHESQEVAAVAEVVDVLQIPAFLCRQTDLVNAAAASGKTVNIKKGQFLAPWDMKHVAAKARRAGGNKLMLTERGTTFGYGNLVNDFRSLVIMREYAPIVFDATHSVQLPGAGQGVSSGDRRFIAPLSRAAVAVGVDGLFMEVHEDPDHALSDGPNSLPIEELPGLLASLTALRAAIAAK
jgi:2-dehydro-3-deoxyphosphooctonate aldolase (KDO 8-P synthase)